MISVRLFVCVILAVWELDHVRARQRSEIGRKLPIFFYTGDELNMNILLRNIPPEANQLTLFYTVRARQRSEIGRKLPIFFYTGDELNMNILLRNKPPEANQLPLFYTDLYTSKNVITYSELERVNFTCPNKTQIGKIDPTGYRITTYDETSRLWNFSKTDNGSMLCCIHFKTHWENPFELVIERVIGNNTLLIYKEAVNHDNGNESAGRVEDPWNLDEMKDPPQPSDKTKYYIAMASTAGGVLFVLLIYVIVKKCTRKASNHEETLQLETYASTNKVLYTELNIRPGNTSAPPTTNNSTYAEIIGVLKPRNEYVKK